ncbi:MAG: hypothetical protein ABGW69_00245 [Nanoarchaeota archaeon]
MKKNKSNKNDKLNYQKIQKISNFLKYEFHELIEKINSFLLFVALIMIIFYFLKKIEGIEIILFYFDIILLVLIIIELIVKFLIIDNKEFLKKYWFIILLLFPFSIFSRFFYYIGFIKDEKEAEKIHIVLHEAEKFAREKELIKMRPLLNIIKLFAKSPLIGRVITRYIILLYLTLSYLEFKKPKKSKLVKK